MTTVTHLVMGLYRSPTGRLATIACTDGKVPHDRSQHTLLSLWVTCPACRAVHAAWVTVIRSQP